jgi:hypothetical protein
VANTFFGRLKTAFNIFRNKDPVLVEDYGYTSGRPVYKKMLSYGNEKSIVNAIYNRCSIDIANLKFRHVRVDENENYVEDINDGLNKCLSLSANIDQSSISFLQDVVISMFDEGCVAIVPVDTSVSIDDNAFDILSMRTGRVVQWGPKSVRVSVYNDETGRNEEITLPKTKVAIVENPFYSVMNQHNSTLHRLIRKLNLLDVIDEQSGSGKLDIIIQLPYVIKTEARRMEAEQRRQQLEDQLKDSKYGVAYADGTEKVTQLNRPVENNLLAQVEYLTKMLYSQLGISEAILAGTASEAEYLNYYNRTLEPICSAIALEIQRKFLTQTAISQGQAIMFFREVFSLTTAKDMAELADKLTRNEIVTSNEFRAIIHLRPSTDPRADELRNKNLNDPMASTVPDPTVAADPNAPVPVGETNLDRILNNG